jgi:hypothetical protein
MIKQESDALKKAAKEKEDRRQAQIKAYVGGRASESLVIVEASVDDPTKEDPKPVKVVRRIAKCHPVSSRHTIEAYRNHVKSEHVVAVQLPDKEEIAITGQTGDPEPVTNVKEKVRHTIKLGAARGLLMKVPYLDPEQDRGSATCDLLFAIQEFVGSVNAATKKMSAVGGAK